MPLPLAASDAVQGACTYLGIDPGASGGLVALCGSEIVATAMPATERDVWEWVRQWKERSSGGQVFALIERVSGYIGEKQPGSAAFKFGQSYGSLRMALVAAGIPFEEIAPRTWQAGLSLSPRKKSETRTAWKNRLKAKAQQIFPELIVTLAVADAILIAEFNCRKREGRL